MSLSSGADDALNIHGAFATWARKHPDAPCVVSSGRTSSYRTVAATADQIARNLASLAVGGGDVVAIDDLPRSEPFVALLLGILSCGAVYTVLPSHSKEQRAAALAKLAPRVVVDKALLLRLALGTSPNSTSRDVPTLSPAEPSTIFFTGGSTGEPKGTISTHGASVTLFSDRRLADFGPGTMMLQAAPMQWDGLTLELWSMLTRGGAVLLADHGAVLTPEDVRRYVELGLTHLWLTASVFNLLVDQDPLCFAGLRHLLTGGEKASERHMRAFLTHVPDVRLTNGYGPAEATVFVTAQHIVAEDLVGSEGVSVGVPVGGAEVIVESPAGEPCEEGQVGEVVVLGDRVGLGYLGRPYDHPFSIRPGSNGEADKRVLHTGDLGYIRDGRLYLAGRIDRQLKIRGMRIDVSALERGVCAAFPLLEARAVAVRDDDGVATGFAMYYRANEEHAADLLDWFARESVISPRRIERVQAFPTTRTGKFDELEMERLARRPSDSAATGDLVASVLARYGILADSSGTLFELGVSSLDALRIGMDLGRNLPSFDARQLTPTSTVAAIRDMVSSVPNQPLERDRVDLGSAEIDDTLRGFVLAQAFDEHDVTALCALRFDCEEALDLDVLLEAAKAVQTAHPLLRARWSLEVVRPGETNSRPLLTAVQHGTLEDALFAYQLEVEDGENWHVVYDNRGGRFSFGIVIHHVIFDGWSEDILRRDFARAYSALLQGQHAHFGTTWGTVVDVHRRRALEQRRLAVAERLDNAAARLAHVRDPHRDERSRAVGLMKFPPTRCHKIAIPEVAVRAVHERAHHTGVEPIAVYLQTYYLSIGVDDTGTSGVPVSTRRFSSELNMIECAIAMAIVRHPRDVEAGDEQLHSIAKEFAEAKAFADVPASSIVNAVGISRSTANPLYSSIFVLQEPARATDRFGALEARFSRPQTPEIAVDLIVDVTPHTHGGATLTVQGSTMVYDMSMLELIGQRFTAALLSS
ncbi:AMP-binding protein [Rathayibacter tritici]|uniref:Tyrocidine synthase 3 n=1 Tax=Rathayibacter tritici TaxID=33888 RepID=A0A160KPR4_9MICO|nr:AMP-binding protein [Rathayibacter tritici]AND15273.1 Tyrocidine synthase 3 [Rathayibacter tritici]PPF22902.1 hypothetical protein C5C06_14660 [Rathayibacter tritici]PPI18637.1 hypothetical protein C5D07_02985 [Rathayibacter tritici]PPI47710.1 hypothetical protein C5D18_03015 [Rathayibacter tritici]